jgi:hypothetical protein
VAPGARSTKRLTIVRGFDPGAPGAWLELCVHVAALANSGGGVVAVDGAVDLSPLPSTLSQYVDTPVELEITDVVTVGPRTGAPVVFERAGMFTDARDVERTAFARGSVYFRHGGRSEPATAKDLQRFIDREVDRQRRSVQRNVRKAVAAPKGAEVLVVSPRKPTALPTVRIVDDPDAPGLARTDFDVTHPYRQKELVARVNERLAGAAHVTPYDIQCVRRTHDIDDRPAFFHRPKFGSPQYSEDYVVWLVDQFERDPQFFEHAKAQEHDRRMALRASRNPE